MLKHTPLPPQTTAVVPYPQEPTLHPRRYMDRRSAAQYLGLSEKFLATHLHDGPTRLRVGSKVIYRTDDLDAWMDRQEVVSQFSY